jgi:hypothetical protein
MAVALKRTLTSSACGRGIKITSTSTAGTLIHTAVSGSVAGTLDEVWLYGYNGHTAAMPLTIEFGGVSVPDDNIILTIPSKTGLTLIVPGLVLQGTDIIRAFAASANLVSIYGYANAISDA